MKKIFCIASAFLASSLICAANAQDAAEDSVAYTPGEGVSYGETPIMSAEFSLNFHSKYMYYGVVDGKDPIMAAYASATFFDSVYFAIDAYFDLTKGNGKKGEYGNRAGEYTFFDSYVGICREFELGERIGTLSVDFAYLYEYIRRYRDESPEDTQYLALTLGLEGHYIVPELYIERDIMADDGTYVNLSLGHTFEISDSFSVTPSIAQGFGNANRTYGYFSDTTDGFHHSGLMDTSLRLDFEYTLNEYITFGAYVAYYDYLLDSNMRQAARDYNGEWGRGNDRSYHFVGGLSVKASF